MNSNDKPTSGPTKVECQYDKMVPIGELQPNPKNPNKHSDAQIERLGKVIKFQGVRSPIVVSNQTGLVIVGHGRLRAMKKIGMGSVPVDYQDFENTDAEYAHMVADNSIADWAELDLSQINFDVGDLGPDLDIDMLGLKTFNIDPPVFEPEIEKQEDKSDNRIECPSCGELFSRGK